MAASLRAQGAAIISHFFRPAVGKGKRVLWNLGSVQGACSRGLLSCAEDRRLAGVAERCVSITSIRFFFTLVPSVGLLARLTRVLLSAHFWKQSLMILLSGPFWV